MEEYRSAVAALTAVVGLVCVGEAQQRTPLPLEPPGIRGEAVWPALEGWYRNPDGTFTILLGYYSRNQETLDIPIGLNNRIEPGGPDLGQPTHFLPRRQSGVFTITVPKDFGNKKLTWTLVANRQTAEVSFWLNPPYYVDPFLNKANGDTPPVIRFAPQGPELQGPPRGMARSLTTTGSEPVTLTVRAKDKPPTFEPPPLPQGVGGAGAGPGGRERRPQGAVTVTWTKYRGPGEVTFSNGKLEIAKPALDEKGEGEVTTTATFTVPGEYVLRATANDGSDEGDQCCWTSAHVHVTVKPAAGVEGR
jgi:hypothetical protein